MGFRFLIGHVIRPVMLGRVRAGFFYFIRGCLFLRFQFLVKHAWILVQYFTKPEEAVEIQFPFAAQSHGEKAGADAQLRGHLGQGVALAVNHSFYAGLVHRAFCYSCL